MIERYQLRYFLAVVDSGNFSRAAALVSVTQPTLSVGIAKLEQAVGAKVFFRNNQRVQLTEAGTHLLRNARTIEREFNAIEGRDAEQAQFPLVRLGVQSTIPTDIIADVISAYRAAGGTERLELVDGTERDLLSRMGRASIDVSLMVVRPGEDRFRSEILFEEGYSVALAGSHPLAPLPLVHAEELAREPMIVRRNCEILSETSRHFTERGVRPHFSFRTTNDEKALKLVRAGLGLTVMPDCYGREGLGRPKLAGFRPTRAIGLLFANPAFAEEGHSPFVRALRTALPPPGV